MAKVSTLLMTLMTLLMTLMTPFYLVIKISALSFLMRTSPSLDYFRIIEKSTGF